MTSRDPSPLTAEEQALAERLARLGPRAEPSPALDARVLAAAHAAAQEPAANRPPPRRQRWPAMVGLAASLVLAVGLAWRLRPQPQPPTTRGEPVAAFRMVVPPASEVAAPAAAAPEPAPAPSKPGRDAGVAAQAPAPETKSPPSPAPPAGRASNVEPPASSAEAIPETPVPAELPPPPPPPDMLRDAAPRARAAAAPAPPPAAPAPPIQDSGVEDTEDEAGKANASSDMRQGDEPTDEVPPATVDSPAVRDAWLERIHGLIDGGDIAGARASLREFQRRYPDYPLPEDLRALAR